MDLHTRHREPSRDPLDVVEQVVAAEQFSYERTGDGEVHFTAPGQRLAHQIWFAWSDQIETLHICSSLETRVTAKDRAKACDLLALLNERLWLGHFDIWSEDGAIVYRNAIALPGGASPEPGQIAALIAAAVEAGERFYPAYNYMVWAGKTAQEAVSAAMFETAGEA
jgi:hypothetical protein